jgi:nitroreductase
MVHEIIKNRRSIREYKSDVVSDETIKELIKAAQFAPTGHGIRAWEFWVIKNPELKKQIQAIIPEQDFVDKVPVLILIGVDIKKTDLFFQDISVATENIFLQAQSMGLGTVWKNLGIENGKQIKKLVGIPDNFEIINLIPVGNPAEIVPPHNDEDFEENRIHWS